MAGPPGCAGPVGVVVDAAALQLWHTGREGGRREKPHRELAMKLGQGSDLKAVKKHNEEWAVPQKVSHS